MKSASNNICLLVHFDSERPRGFHKMIQTGINYDMHLFIPYILIVKGQRDHDMLCLLYILIVKGQGVFIKRARLVLTLIRETRFIIDMNLVFHI